MSEQEQVTGVNANKISLTKFGIRYYCVTQFCPFSHNFYGTAFDCLPNYDNFVI